MTALSRTANRRTSVESTSVHEFHGCAISTDVLRLAVRAKAVIKYHGEGNLVDGSDFFLLGLQLFPKDQAVSTEKAGLSIECLTMYVQSHARQYPMFVVLVPETGTLSKEQTQQDLILVQTVAILPFREHQNHAKEPPWP